MTARDIVMSAAGNSGDSKTYIEDVFSTYLYTGNGSTQTINNGIDLAGKGGMVWVKSRGATTWSNNLLVDTARGSSSRLYSDLSNSAATDNSSITGFSSTGFGVGNGHFCNDNGITYASWTFRKAPKFFDVVTWTGNGVAGRTISHSLGQAPGMIIIKRTSSDSFWRVYHRSLGATKVINLEQTAAAETSSAFWNDTEPTSTVFTVGNQGNVNGNGDQFVAYLFAHDTSTDGLIQCGSFTTDASGNATVNLGWEPQYVLSKVSGTTGNWHIWDEMRGFYATDQGAATLYPNLSNAENSMGPAATVNATGFQVYGEFASKTYIYMAIRRGPMRTPTDATKVFDVDAYTGDAVTSRKLTVGFPTDASLIRARAITTNFSLADVLRGLSTRLYTDSTQAEAFNAAIRDNTTYQLSDGTTRTQNSFDITYISYFFQRAPGFFDVVCYTGTGVARTVNHNLGVAPELLIVKRRNSTSSWYVYNTSIGSANALQLNYAFAATSGSGIWNSTDPTSSGFTVGTGASNSSGGTYVAYLFASCPGVSKVGSFTYSGNNININCGFTNGARFVMYKCTSSTGDWVVYDTARGITVGNDPHLSLNSTAAEVTSGDYVMPYSAGFTIESGNLTNGTYIYLAIA